MAKFFRSAASSTPIALKEGKKVAISAAEAVVRDNSWLKLSIRRKSHGSTAEVPEKISYMYGASSVPLIHHTIGERLRLAVEECPEREMVVFRHENVRKTYQELYADARKLAAAFIHLGVERGDRVGIWGPNYYEWVVTQFATAMAGLVLVNVNPAYQSEELRFALYKAGVKVLVTPPKYKSSNYYKTLKSIIPEMSTRAEGVGWVRNSNLPELKHIVLFKPQADRKYKGVWYYDEVLNSPSQGEYKTLNEFEDSVRTDDPVNIQYTSGTTGYPKAATLTHHNIVNNSFFVGKRLGFDTTHNILCLPPPLYHTFGCVMGVLNAVNHKQTIVLPSPSFNAEAALKAIVEEKATMLYGTPTMFIDILNRPELTRTDLSSLRGGIIAGAPCPTTLCERLIKELHMKDFVVCYGSTEISPVATMSFPADKPEERTRSVGHVLDHLEVAIMNPEGKFVSRGEKGELVTRGYSTMRGYYHDEERTRDTITPDRWYHTGDVAIMNADGSVVISGRSKDMIIRGGENIYPTEIEQFLFKHPCVADAHVIGVPDERYGEEICAWIRLKPDCDLDAQGLKDYCRGKISHNKIPKYVLFKNESEFPLTATGKVQKFELRNISRRELGLEQVKSHFNL